MPITIKNSAGGGVTLDSTTSSNETLQLPSGGGTLAPLASPSFTGTTSANKLNVTGVVDNTISGTLVVKGSLSANQTSGLALFQQSSTASTIKAFGPDATTTGILNTYVAASDGSPDSLITSVTADGLTFNGDTAAANALDDYEEGTYTPVAKAGSTVISTTNQGTLYTKIGRQVNLSMYLIMGSSANISSISLPFASISSVNVRYAGAMASYNMPKSGSQYSPLIEQNSAVMGLWQMNDNTAATTTWSVDNNSEVFITITYFTDA